MKKFERFIIYPLLIMTLFYSFAGEQVTTTAQDVIDKLVVREISVIDEEGNEVVNIDSVPYHGGEIMIYGGPSDSFSKISGYSFQTVIDNNMTLVSQLGFTIQQFDEDPITPPKRFVDIGVSNNGNGYSILNNSHGDPLIYIGFNENGHGLINVYDKYGENWRSYGFR